MWTIWLHKVGLNCLTTYESTTWNLSKNSISWIFILWDLGWSSPQRSMASLLISLDPEPRELMEVTARDHHQVIQVVRGLTSMRTVTEPGIPGLQRQIGLRVQWRRTTLNSLHFCAATLQRLSSNSSKVTPPCCFKSKAAQRLNKELRKMFT